METTVHVRCQSVYRGEARVRGDERRLPALPLARLIGIWATGAFSVFAT